MKYADWKGRYRSKILSVEEAAQLIKSGDRVLLPMQEHPIHIAWALAKRKDELRGVTLLGNWIEPYPWLQPGMEESFYIVDFFGSRATRQGMKDGWIEWNPLLFGLGTWERFAEGSRSSVFGGVDFYLTKVGPPNEEGYCSFGPACWYSPTAIKMAKTVIAEVSPSVPWVFGGHVHISELDYLIEAPSVRIGLPGHLPIPSPEEQAIADVIGAFAASLIRDGDTIQVGVGTASEATLQFLDSKNDLGVYSEVIYPQVVELGKRGIVTRKKRNIGAGKVTASGIQIFGADPRIGEALAYVTENPMFELIDSARLCHISHIAAQDNMVAINTIMAVDLLGQVAVTHISGPHPLSGPGGQVEFNIGTHYSKGGRSISCLPSTSQGGKVSRILPQFETGLVVTLPMFYLDYLVTEHGIANLENKTRREKAEAIIEVAHPDFRPELRKAAQKLYHL